MIDCAIVGMVCDGWAGIAVLWGIDGFGIGIGLGVLGVVWELFEYFDGLDGITEYMFG